MTFILFSNGKKIEDAFLLRDFQDEKVGIFESLRTYNGRIFRQEEHLARLLESAKTAGVSKVPDIPILRRELKLALLAFQKCHSKAKGRRISKPRSFAEPALSAAPLRMSRDAFLRLTLWQGRIFVMVGERFHPAALYKKGVVLQTSPVRRAHSNASAPEAKTSDYQNALLATLEPAPGETYEWLFLDQNGFVTEVRIGNLFMIKHNVLLTPPARGILDGVTRRFVIECAPQAGMRVEETPLTRHEVFNAEEAFLTNTSWEILPVRQLDSRRIGQKVPGPGTQKLQRIFTKKILKECPS